MIILKKWKKYTRRNQKETRIYLFILFLLIISFIFSSYFLEKSTFFQDIGSMITKCFIPKNVNYQNATSLQEQSLKEEVAELKNLLDLKENMAGYELIYTTVVNRNQDYWFYNLTVDKGKKDGVEVDMIVVNQDGLVGRVIETHNHTSIVKLISANDSLNKIAVDVVSSDSTYKGILSGYDLVNNKILITSIRSSSDIQEGDTVLTNGIGNLFPSGIMVGTVSEITSDDLGVSKVLKVDSKVDFENLRYLAILKRGNES